MATIFEDQTTDYSGESSPETGVALVRVAYSVTPDTYGRLRILARPTGSSQEFIPMRFPNGDTFQHQSDIVTVDVSGLDYYYEWKIKSDVGDTEVTATLTEY